MLNKKKILIFTLSESQSSYEVKRVIEEGYGMGIRVKRVLYSALKFEIKNEKMQVFVGGEEIVKENTMGVWFRVAGTTSGKYVIARNLLINILQKEGVFCVNSDGYSKWPRMGKITQYGVYAKNGISVVSTRVFYNKDGVGAGFGEMERDFGWPIIVKNSMGYQGKSVMKLDNKKDLNKFLNGVDEKDLGLYMWQRCLKTRWDLRVVVINGRAVGAMKRIAVGDEFRSNFSLGGNVEKWELSEKERKLAEKVAEICGLDYCGVDLMKDKSENMYVLEVNRACQFKGFEKATGINVGRLILEMFLNK
ncbi:ATP-grasp domain-containing protein [Patescibacteria group bacterium]|nr:ATP-grasp domain-containing protein [Patescibacteria group bacterium]MCG2702493.1 ATP-grasp domain-containing protein [Candidatus Parcubacteria bacterium]MBU4264546.1 ATP-grasp domain-containing protein [Patescibacteria group bacterium]MBU4390214.1 ATP-grasp domain-containing protein [Patescibacteria group bacterium]MBU4397277.1 ATP-grasp domain-containing protein [Patescibacteria group bacterium]